MRIKQVILIRRDLKMRRGKEIAQGSHASMEFLVSHLRSGQTTIVLSEAETTWISQGTAKICLQVDGEEQLKDMHAKAKEAGLTSFLIKDSGRTEFGGVPTYTACAIGPESAESIDKITGELSLY